MEKSILNHGSPEVLEARRIAEIKSLSYVERLERLFAIIEVSYMMRNAAKNQNQIIRNEPTNN
ncbi:hypothetical protein [Flavobacterium laiguense]|uniref:Uncharacterized protein n=1 Tax=Flavobacterium laiguense TaxID=2169409 RepID=A0A2U1JWD6_9FLAO|nr:hypothetical protein [Flavobacterium laiguense]PWA09305.1 hypothetical protein DB891_08425 [Flavobacterium laiguense]